MQCHQWIEANQKALKRHRQKSKGNYTDAQLIKYAKDLGFAFEPQVKKRAVKKKVVPPRIAKQKRKATNPDDYEKRHSKILQSLCGLQRDYFWCLEKCVKNTRQFV